MVYFLQPVTCQKLIHGGKLLLDQSTLAEAIPLPLHNPEEANESTVIHLVAYERSKSVPSTTALTGAGERVHSSAGDGLRNRPGTSRQPPNPVQANRQPSNPAQANRQPANTAQGASPPGQPTQRVSILYSLVARLYPLGKAKGRL